MKNITDRWQLKSLKKARKDELDEFEKWSMYYKTEDLIKRLTEIDKRIKQIDPNWETIFTLYYMK